MDTLEKREQMENAAFLHFPNVKIHLTLTTTPCNKHCEAQVTTIFGEGRKPCEEAERMKQVLQLAA